MLNQKNYYAKLCFFLDYLLSTCFDQVEKVEAFYPALYCSL